MSFDVVTLTLKVDLLYKKNDRDYDFWIRGVTFCCYLHMVAAGELCCLSDNSGSSNLADMLTMLRGCALLILEVTGEGYDWHYWQILGSWGCYALCCYILYSIYYTVYMTLVKSRELHYDVMKTNCFLKS